MREGELETGPAPPHGRYKRGLEGADFTLEANTENVPPDGRFYVLRAGETLLETEDFGAAVVEYNRLSREFWTERLESPVLPTRIAAAWGILSLDATDKQAQQIIIEMGSPQERKRLEQAQSRRRALRARAGNVPAAVTAVPAAEAPAPAEPEEAAESEEAAEEE